LVPFRPRL
uniref:Pyrokinin-3 n=1 Tax=Periplaneta americana TaxID=6978 RepID=PPK3_PERAM|nr:RecName: Full=Pyrokinin-3; Short=Pea-PK-3; AltName: Full=FXPRL-amide [Periplaneta americana]